MALRNSGRASLGEPVAAEMVEQLAGIVGVDNVLRGTPRPYGFDATNETLGLRGEADAVVKPADTEEVRRIVEWCYRNEVALIPRGGGTGFAGGAVPVDGGVVVSLERLTEVFEFDPARWSMHVGAGLSTGTVARLARENGLFFPPNPGAAEQSQIGGNVATNAGGARAFKYGVTGKWVTGLEVVTTPGEILRIGGFTRKDTAGYDLRSLMIGSEGTLGVVTGVWLSLLPAPEKFASLVAFYPDVASGAAAIEMLTGAGLMPTAIEFADPGALSASKGSFPHSLDARSLFMVLVEFDGSVEEVERNRSEAMELLADGVVEIWAPPDRSADEQLARWRDGISAAVTSIRGGKLSEDVAVPPNRLRDLVDGVVEIGAKHGLDACSWGHAGDGNIHASFLIPRDEPRRDAAAAAALELCDLAVEMGGTYSGEHGTGWVKRGRIERQWGPTGSRFHNAIKQVFDPKGLLNPGKKS